MSALLFAVLFALAFNVAIFIVVRYRRCGMVMRHQREFLKRMSEIDQQVQSTIQRQQDCLEELRARYFGKS